MRTILTVAILLSSIPHAEAGHRHCDGCGRHERPRYFTYEHHRDGGFRYFEGQEYTPGTRYYGENGGTVIYGNE